jgi:hypothetical protein
MASVYCSNKKGITKWRIVKNEWQNGMRVTSTVSIYIHPRKYDKANKQKNEQICRKTINNYVIKVRIQFVNVTHDNCIRYC